MLTNVVKKATQAWARRRARRNKVLTLDEMRALVDEQIAFNRRLRRMFDRLLLRKPAP